MPDTMQQVVTDGVAAFGAVENGCLNLHGGIAVLSGIIDRGQALNMGGALAANAMRADLMVAQGYVAQALATISRLHSQCTKIAQDENVDVPAPASGGIR